MLLRERRFLNIALAIAVLYVLSLWMLDAIQRTGVTPSAVEITPTNENAEAETPGTDAASLAGTDDVPSEEERAARREQLAARRSKLEGERREAIAQIDRLRRRLAAMEPGIEQSRAAEETLNVSWNVLPGDAQGELRYTETMARDYLDLKGEREALRIRAVDLDRRRQLLDDLLGGVENDPTGALASAVDSLEREVGTTTRACQELARRAERLAGRAREGSRGERLDEAVVRIESADVTPELIALSEQRRTEIADELDQHLERLAGEARRAAEEEVREKRLVAEREAASIHKATADMLAEFKAEKERLDAEVETKRAAVVFQANRAQIEHYLVPFIALKRTYLTPVVMEKELQEFAWADIPLEAAASLHEIRETGVFETGADSYRRLGPFMRARIDMLDERYLPFGQSWSYENENYLILARAILLKHGEAMVQAGLLRP
ncbi:hypothetical protein JW916_01005 [Candidatus Sumerlaeota bacterium]|nr:hypothetical protein [Candidatus Sumerlaeota bacterium]